jgi:hypothetical protein
MIVWRLLLGGLFSKLYNIAFVNSERFLAKSRVDITQCQHGNVWASEADKIMNA